MAFCKLLPNPVAGLTLSQSSQAVWLLSHPSPWDTPHPKLPPLFILSWKIFHNSCGPSALSAHPVKALSGSRVPHFKLGPPLPVLLKGRQDRRKHFANCKGQGTWKQTVAGSKESPFLVVFSLPSSAGDTFMDPWSQISHTQCYWEGNDKLVIWGSASPKNNLVRLGGGWRTGSC